MQMQMQSILLKVLFCRWLLVNDRRVDWCAADDDDDDGVDDDDVDDPTSNYMIRWGYNLPVQVMSSTDST